MHESFATRLHLKIYQWFGSQIAPDFLKYVSGGHFHNASDIPSLKSFSKLFDSNMLRVGQYTGWIIEKKTPEEVVAK